MVSSPAAMTACDQSNSGTPSGGWMSRHLEIGLWGLPVLTGTAIRLFQIQQQVILDDEWHALNKLISSSYADIISDFGIYDYSIPLTLFYRAIADTTGLSEILMRLPALAAGIAALVLVPWLLRGMVSRKARYVVAWLIAISPVHVFFSRYARPYSIILLIGFLGVVALYRWWNGGRRLWAAAYIVSAACGPYFNLACTPVLSAAPAYCFIDRLVRKEKGPRTLVSLLFVCALAALGAGTLLLAPLVHSIGTLSIKMAQGDLGWWGLSGAAQLLLGNTAYWLLVVQGALVLLGVLVVGTQSRQFNNYVLFLVFSQVLAVLILHPASLQAPIVLTRYCLVGLPFLLAWLAAGITDFGRRLAILFRPLATAGPVLFVALLIVKSPLLEHFYQPDNFTQHAYLQYYFDQELYLKCFRPKVVPAFYFQLSSRKKASLTIVEAPWYFYWSSFAYYQTLHGQNVRIGFVGQDNGRTRPGELPKDDRRFHFRSFIHVQDLLNGSVKKADYIILHKKLHEENPSPFGDQPVDIGYWLNEFNRACGKPVFEDDWIAVFDLTRKAPSPGSSSSRSG